MKKQLIFLAISLLWGMNVMSQQATWVFLSDKGDCVAERLAEPEAFLSPAAIAARQAKGLQLDASDLPVFQAYVEELKIHSYQVLSTSKWLNAVAVQLPAECLEEVEALDFVTGTRPVQTLVQSRATPAIDEGPITPAYPRYVEEGIDYGESSLQNEMLAIPELHAMGYTGKGVTIALLDAGFDGADTIDVFDSIWADKRVLATYDFVGNKENVFGHDAHGTQVMSTIGANIPGEMVGTAPHATFVLCRTEEAGREYRQEEHNWVRAIEFVDSIGVDVVHSSLGYSEFDDSGEDYTYEDMNGNTAVTTRAADYAASKGIIVTTSAGNEGYGSWKHITAPCDADSVLCIGSTNKYGKRSGFSSIGPSADGRVKPDVMAMGSRTTVASPRNYITHSDGTSFSGPLMGGFVACLRQAHPERSNMDIIQAVILSGDQFHEPNAEYGYGIPSATLADSILRHVEDMDKFTPPVRKKISRPVASAKPKAKQKKLVVFSDNPQSALVLEKGVLTVKTSSTIRKIEIMRGNQKVILNPKHTQLMGSSSIMKVDFLEKGDYYLKIKTANYQENVKFSL